MNSIKLYYIITIHRPQTEILWIVGMGWDTSGFPLFANCLCSLKSPLNYIAQCKLPVTGKSYTTNTEWTDSWLAEEECRESMMEGEVL